MIFKFLPVGGVPFLATSPTDAQIRTEEDWLKLHPDAIKPSHSMFDLENVPQDMLFWLTMLMLGKKDPRSVERILVTMYQSAGKAMEAYCRAGVANRITAWGSGRLLSLYMERLGLITQPQAFAFSDGLSVMAGASIAESLTGIVLPWSFSSEDTQFPDQVTLAETGETKISGGSESRRSWRIGSGRKYTGKEPKEPKIT